KLTAVNAASGDAFAYSVALDGDTALVGAHLDDDQGPNSGAAYVLVGSGALWAQQQKLAFAAGAAQDEPGSSVALDGNTALVGACQPGRPR
ncbi:MAG: hypothetical protein HY744_31415, partial [Deltaproteobacteria bacterium]|nr:hypothetical protein [Deltaproteobacteria bacterium]